MPFSVSRSILTDFMKESSLSTWANKLVPIITDAFLYFLLTIFAVSKLKNLWIVLTPLFFAIFAIFVGSMPKVLNFNFLNPINSVPSLDPISIAKGFLPKLNFFFKYDGVFCRSFTRGAVILVLYG